MTYYTLFAIKTEDDITKIVLSVNGEKNDSYIKNVSNFYVPISLNYDDEQFSNILKQYKKEPKLFLICSPIKSNEFMEGIINEFDNKTYVTYNKDLVNTNVENWAFDTKNIKLYENELEAIKNNFERALQSSSVSICIYGGFENMANITQAVNEINKHLNTANDESDKLLYNAILQKWIILHEKYKSYLNKFILSNNVYIIFVDKTSCVSSITEEADFKLTLEIINTINYEKDIIRIPNIMSMLLDDLKELMVKTIMF